MEFNIEILRGSSALSRLEDKDFGEQWVSLYNACGWATAWQSLDFNQIWFATYFSDFDPLIVTERDRSGSVSGLLALAVDRRTGGICHAGAAQTEYEVWLARDDRRESFIISALDALSRLYPKGRLRLAFVPPGSPVAWASKHARWSKRVVVRREPRWLMSLGVNSRVESSLKKSGTRSRINRLRRLGSLELVRLSTRAELEAVIGEIGEYHDLVQGARHDMLPFASDPKKREFWLRLAERPGLIHVAVLLVNGKIVAANIGPIERDSVSIGLFVYSPFHAKYSPGKILVLLLARHLAEMQFPYLDLTPGRDEYKRNTADHHHEAFAISVWFDPLEGMANWLRDYVRRTIVSFPRGRMLVKLRNVTSGGNRAEAVRKLQLGKGARAVEAPIAQREAKPDQREFLLRDQGLRHNQLDHLIAGARRFRAGRAKFLSEALSRIESGDEFFTRKEGGHIVELIWVSGLGS